MILRNKRCCTHHVVRHFRVGLISVTVPRRLANTTCGPVSLCHVFTNIFRIKLGGSFEFIDLLNEWFPLPRNGKGYVQA